MSEGELAGMGWIWVVAVTVRLQLQPNGPVSGKPTIRPSGLGDRSYTPDFESGRAPSEKLRKVNKTLGIRGFSPDQMSDLLSQVEFPRWTKSGRTFLRKWLPFLTFFRTLSVILSRVSVHPE